MEVSPDHSHCKMWDILLRSGWYTHATVLYDISNIKNQKVYHSSTVRWSRLQYLYSTVSVSWVKIRSRGVTTPTPQRYSQYLIDIYQRKIIDPLPGWNLPIEICRFPRKSADLLIYSLRKRYSQSMYTRFFQSKHTFPHIPLFNAIWIISLRVPIFIWSSPLPNQIGRRISDYRKRRLLILFNHTG
jgi:hypothetical protein